MANITKRTNRDGSFSWRVRLMKYGQTRTATFPTKREAQDWSVKIEHEILNQTYFPERVSSTEYTMSDAIARYVEEILPQKSPGSQRKQGQILKWWNENLGDAYLNNITPELIDKYKYSLWKKKQYSAYTVNLYLDTIFHVFSVAASPLWKWLHSNPATHVKRLKTKERLPDITDDQLTMLLWVAEQCKVKWVYYFIVIALSTGGRKSEILNLKCGQVLFPEFRIIFKNTKSGKDRVLPITEPCFRAFVSLYNLFGIDIVPNPNLNVFPGGANNSRLNILRREWTKIKTQANLPHLRIHDLRHLFASRLATKAGADIGAIADLLGHSQLAHTRRYTHLTTQHNRELMSKMSDAVFHTG